MKFSKRRLPPDSEKNEKLIGKVLSSGHTSVLEHGYVNLAFENVSVLAEQFLIEFRLASFTVKSRRYVDFSRRGLCLAGLDRRRAGRRFLTRRCAACFAIYDELEAAGVPKEDARFVLPYCFCSNFFCSMNARELVHVMNELTLWARERNSGASGAGREPVFAVRGEAAVSGGPERRGRTPKRRCRCRTGEPLAAGGAGHASGWNAESPKGSSAARHILQAACRRRS